MDKLFSLFISITIFIFVAPVFSYDEIECSMPNNYETTVGNLFAKFVDGSLKIKFDRDSFKIYFRESKLRNVNFLIKNAIIDFKGKYGFPAMSELLHPVNYTSHIRVIGSTIVQSLTEDTGIISKIQTFLAKYKTFRPDIPFAIENEIVDFASKCLNTKLSGDIGNIMMKDVATIDDSYNFGPFSVSANGYNGHSHNQIMHENKKKLIAMQLALNTIIDIGSMEIRKMLIDSNMTSLELPSFDHLNTPLSSIFSKCKFNITGGSFRDPTSFMRIGNVVIAQEGKKYSISFSVRLRIAEVNYKNYMVKCFKIKSSGSLEVTVGIVDVGIHLAIDFGEQNCKAKLESFQIEQFKKLKVNFINSKLKLFSKLINYIVNSKRQMIVDIITESISALIKSELDKLECDSYKPTDN